MKLDNYATTMFKAQKGNKDITSLALPDWWLNVWNRWQLLLAKARPWGRLADMSNNQSHFVSYSVTFQGVEMSPQ